MKTPYVRSHTRYYERLATKANFMSVPRVVSIAEFIEH